jgi:hypothetical protein
MKQLDIVYEEALSVSFESRDHDGQITVREYLRSLLSTLWAEKEGFSGKRPFGNSGWDFDLIAGLVKSGHIKGTLDEYGYIEDLDSHKDANKFVADLIEYVLKA